MIAIKWIFLGLVGISSGLAVAGGVFAFITMLGIIPRLAARTKTAKHIVWYERMVIWGGTLGNIWILFMLPFHATPVLLAIFGFCAGIYVGCLVMALAEMLRLLPILVNRLQIQEGFPILVASLALGKAAGTLFQYFF